jgi:hypothetical protein
MQDKTINNALLARYRTGEARVHVDALMALVEMIGDKEPNVRNKLSRGKFSAAYLLQCAQAIGLSELRL